MVIDFKKKNNSNWNLLFIKAYLNKNFINIGEKIKIYTYKMN